MTIQPSDDLNLQIGAICCMTFRNQGDRAAGDRAASSGWFAHAMNFYRQNCSQQSG
eukprot:SAG31_NODE_46096_length_256_cov_0.624204_1_plen_55_part_10